MGGNSLVSSTSDRVRSLGLEECCVESVLCDPNRVQALSNVVAARALGKPHGMSQALVSWGSQMAPFREQNQCWFVLSLVLEAWGSSTRQVCLILSKGPLWYHGAPPSLPTTFSSAKWLAVEFIYAPSRVHSSWHGTLLQDWWMDLLSNLALRGAQMSLTKAKEYLLSKIWCSLYEVLPLKDCQVFCLLLDHSAEP